jgi:hypothetical protein
MRCGVVAKLSPSAGMQMIKTGPRNPHVIVRAADAVLATITGGVRSAMKSVSQSNTRSTFRTAAESCQPECRGRRYQTRRTCPAAPWRRHDPCRRRRSRHCVLRRHLPQRSDTTDTLADWQQLMSAGDGSLGDHGHKAEVRG